MNPRMPKERTENQRVTLLQSRKGNGTEEASGIVFLSEEDRSCTRQVAATRNPPQLPGLQEALSDCGHAESRR